MFSSASEKKRRFLSRARNPPLDDQHAGLHLRLVARLGRPGREDGGAVVGGHVGERLSGGRLVETGPHDRRLEVVRHDHVRHAAEEPERPDMRADPVSHALGPGRLGVREIGRPHDGDEDLRLTRRAGGGIDHRNGLAGVVDEQLLARQMMLAHGHRQLA